MTSIRAAALAAAVSASAVAQAPASCSFWFEEVGYNYDLSSLTAKAPYSYTYGAGNYLFTFCGTLNNNPCPSGMLASSLQLPPGSSVGCLKSYGSWSKVEASMLTGTPTDGLKLVYQSGSPCGQFESYSTAFNLQCDPSVPSSSGVSFVDVSQPTQCSLQYTLKTAAACPVQKLKTVPSLGAGWIVFIVFVVGLAAYLIIGSAYKRLVKGASGMEALPNIDTWRSVWAFITCQNRTGGKGRYLQALGAEDGGGFSSAEYHAAPGETASSPA